MRPHARLAAAFSAASAFVAPAVFALPAPFVGASASAYFSDDAVSADLAAELVRGARQRVLVAGYASLSPKLAAALCDARRRGIAVRVVLDRSVPALRYSGAALLAETGVEVVFARRAGLIRAPFLVVDDAVATEVAARRAGLARAASGAAALLPRADMRPGVHELNVFHDVPRLAQAYAQTFWRLYRVAAAER
ncbi:MAG: phospholipase D-like domain-containing protein [Burkholderia gladioli]